jgi:hypothetical protein
LEEFVTPSADMMKKIENLASKFRNKTIKVKNPIFITEKQCDLVCSRQSGESIGKGQKRTISISEKHI